MQQWVLCFSPMSAYFKGWTWSRLMCLHTAIQASGLSRTACYSLSRLSQHINSHITLQWLDTAKVYMQARPWLQPLCVLHNDTAAVDAKPRLTYELILQRLDMIQADVQVWPQ